MAKKYEPCLKEGCTVLAHWEIENLNGGETVYACNDHIHLGIEWDNTAKVSSTYPTILGKIPWTVPGARPKESNDGEESS